MRSDMAKVIVERERLGGQYSRKRKPPRDPEDAPQKEGMRRPWKNRKSLNENLSPLKRYLRSNVGRPWDDIYSEVCANLKPTSTVQQHVRDHVEGFVELHVEIQSGRAYHKSTRYRHRIELWYDQLYVHPETGILSVYKRRDDRRPPAPPKDLFLEKLNKMIGAKGRLERRDGILYKCFDDEKVGVTIYHRANAAMGRIDGRHVNLMGFMMPYHEVLEFFVRNRTKFRGDEYLEALESEFWHRLEKAGDNREAWKKIYG